jgi:tRNA (cmo5U34)-methyltransferase
MKSTPDEIRRRFDADVERFSNLETGQSATIDAPLVLDLVTHAAAISNPQAMRLLDVGCGAGNYSLKMLQRLPDLEITLVDLSQPMLDRAKERIASVTSKPATMLQADIRGVTLAESSYDIILAAAVLHHLRTDEEWEAVFRKFYTALKSGGSLWISDLVTHTSSTVQTMMWERYGLYLADFKDAAYRDHVFAYVEKEDTPRPLLWQLDLLRKIGFRNREILHKNSVFAAFGAVK